MKSYNNLTLADNFFPLSDVQSSGTGDAYKTFEDMKKLQILEHTSTLESIFFNAPQNNLSNFNNHQNSSVEEQLYNKRAELKIIAAQCTITYINNNFRKDLFNQLDWVLDPDSWVEGDILAQPESFRTLIKFILNAKPIEAPSLGLSHKGNILASWQHKQNTLELECNPKENIKWFVSCVFEDKKERTYGEAFSLKRLLEVLSPYKNAGWFYQNEKTI